MGDEPTSLSDLLRRCRPFSAASSLPSGYQNPNPNPNPHNQTHQPCSNPQNPNTPKILKPIRSKPLIGTLTLTTPSSSCLNSSCLKFTDHTATVCCDIINNFDLQIIGQRIKILAFNFIPVKPNCGYLEIIKWHLEFDPSDINNKPIDNKPNNFNGFYLNSVVPTYQHTIIPRCLLFGLLISVSPVTSVPCTVTKTGTKTLTGFVAEVTVCECELCSSKDPLTLPQGLTGIKDKDHIFTKSKIVYFCGDASVWYPVVSRMVGRTVSVSGMKKKMVFLGEGKSLMMYVTTEKAVIHLPMCTSKTAINGRNANTTNTLNVYTGSITATYMQGMVVELDQKVLVLLTDNQLSMPHGLRIGAIVTVRNFHIEDPKFTWTKVIIFGLCYKTSIRVNVFSPIESGCYQVLQSRSLLRKFIESLQFSARLWVLLVISSMRKKFAGVLSEMEILGSKHMEGLVQKYCSSCLPLSVFRFRHGVLSEYCLHDLCGCGKEIDYDAPKLVAPISNFISQCEDLFIKKLYDTNHKYSSIVCGGKSHEQSIRKIIKSEDMNIVLLGNLKISEYSGKLQLVDATGCIDVVIPDLPSVWSIKDIYEINEFSVVIEGFSRDLKHLELLDHEPFTCGNIFNHFRLSERKKINIYINCYMKDAKSINHILHPSVDMEENLKEFESGLFHLILLAHKFPIQQKFPGDYAVSNNSSFYAEVIILPWNLVLHNDVVMIDSSRDDKRCDLSFQHEFPCTVDFYGEKPSVNLGDLLYCTRAAKKVLLEFKSDSFWKFETLRIGGYYLIKHHHKGLVCTTKDFNKVSMDSKSHFWNVSFSADLAGPATARSIYLHLSVEHLSFLEIKLKELKQDFIKPTNSIKVTSASPPSGAFNVNLPTGNLLFVQGRVMAVHTSGQSRPLARAHPCIGHRVTTTSVCIHVLVDRNMVKIYSSLSEHSYPTGFGPGVKANFHRVLLTAEGGTLKLTPASVIEIESIIIDNNQCNNESDITSVTSVEGTTTSLLTGPTVLISEMARFSVHKKVRLHCKVISVYVLVMEKNSDSRVDFPFAGFIMDDGSSSCCCWTDTKTVLTLLGSREWSPHKRSRTSLHKAKRKKLEACGDTMSRLSDILNQNGRVVIKNNGSVSDSSCLDAVISVDSECVIKESDEQFLKGLILQVSSSNSWNVVGSVMDSEGLNQIVEELQRVDMMMKLPLVNIWASEVSYLDNLNEGRSILQELLKSE
ncbi:CST complex subunit CTC1-like [Bidens hawaiensis]|uniref:CST complex subunit CTC1-like n=1 Tax=Bidens hawaiensis TaxID=980011 RepID=UPI00404B67DE